MAFTHYFSEKQPEPKQAVTFTTIILNHTLTFITYGGIFSFKKIDNGTHLLITESIIQPGWKLLDLGCGYGPIGIALQKAHPDLIVHMSDINELALRTARANAKNNHVEVTIKKSDKLTKIPDTDYNTILLNPPHTAGKKTCMEMIDQAHTHLTTGGLLQLVARHNKGGKTLSTHMHEVFGNCEDIAKSGGYRIYISKKQ